MNKLKTANNVEFKGFSKVEELNEQLPTFTVSEPSIEKWNRKAMEKNTKLFIQVFNKQPGNYKEVRAWIQGTKESQSAPNELTFF